MHAARESPALTNTQEYPEDIIENEYQPLQRETAHPVLLFFNKLISQKFLISNL